MMFDPEHEPKVELSQQATDAQIQTLREQAAAQQRLTVNSMGEAIGRRVYVPAEGDFKKKTGKPCVRRYLAVQLQVTRSVVRCGKPSGVEPGVQS